MDKRTGVAPAVELRHISAFLMLAEELHFGRAAERLHLAQPSLSLQLKQLERRVGVQLVARTSHRVWLTPAGEAFRRESGRLLDQLEVAMESARNASVGAGGRIRIGFNFPAGQHVIIPALHVMRRRNPDIATPLTAKHTRGQLAGLRDGSLDIAFVYGSSRQQGLRQRAITALPLVGLCSGLHPLAHLGSVQWAELGRHRCVLPSPATSPAMYDSLLVAARSAGVDLSHAETFDDGDAAAVRISAEEIVIFASEPRAASIASPEIATLSLVDPVPQVTVHAVWRDDDVNPALPIFLEAMDEVDVHCATGRR